MLDILAYSILTLAFIFIVLPMIGSLLTDENITYFESMLIGGIVLSTFGVIGLITWALEHLTK